MTTDHGMYIMEDVKVINWETTDHDEKVQHNSMLLEEYNKANRTLPQRHTTHVVHRQTINPSYDPTLPYTPRSQRPDEWCCVSIIGQVVINNTETLHPNWVVMKRNGPDTQWVYIR